MGSRLETRRMESFKQRDQRCCCFYRQTVILWRTLDRARRQPRHCPESAMSPWPLITMVGVNSVNWPSHASESSSFLGLLSLLGTFWLALLVTDSPVAIVKCFHIQFYLTRVFGAWNFSLGAKELPPRDSLPRS